MQARGQVVLLDAAADAASRGPGLLTPDRSPSWQRLLAWRMASVAVAISGGTYLWWRYTTLSSTGAFGIFFYIVECITFTQLIISIVLIARVRWRPSRVPRPSGTLDVFVTVCGEPVSMLERTLQAALAISYPHETYLLNDGRFAATPGWERIEDLAMRYGVTCFTRTTGTRGKAGNLNHALALTNGEFIATIDADHVASADLAEQMLGYFVDDAVGFVCSSQRFETAEGDVLNNREPFFYRFLQPAKDVDSSAFSCGNGTVYRRVALRSIHGFSEWNLVEDLHSSYLLHAAGWRSVYHPYPVTCGSAPAGIAVYLRQRMRWATDSARLLLWDTPLRKRGLSTMQRLHYLHTTSFYPISSLQLVLLLSPPLYVFWRISALNGSSLNYPIHALPYFMAILCFFTVHVGARAVMPLLGSAIFCSPVYLLAFGRALFRLRPDSTPTEKEQQPWFSMLLLPQFAALAALLGAIVFAAFDRRAGGSAIAVVWAGVLAALLAGPLTAVEKRRKVAKLSRWAIRGGVLAACLALVAPQLVPGLPNVAAAFGCQRLGASHSATSALPPAPRNLAVGERLAPPRDGAYLGVSQPDLLVCADSIIRWGRTHGHPARIVNWFQQWRGGAMAFRADWMRAVARQGAVPMVTWEPWEKPPGGFRDPEQPAFRLQRIARGDFDRYIWSWARAAAEYQGPILIRLMQEMNGDWYPWGVGVNGNTPADYVAAWRHVHRIFDAAGATSVSWVWAIHAYGDGFDSSRRPGLSYPGASYVDWVSMTSFNWGTLQPHSTWREPDQLFSQAYDALRGYRKPVMVSEIGTVKVGGDPSKWMTRTVDLFAARYTRVRAVVWLDARYSRRADFRLRGSTGEAFRAAGAKYWNDDLRMVVVPNRSGR
jgi:cellulose synthase (UDP-forming)